MNKRDRMNEQILRHGFKLVRIFFGENRYDISPVGLAKSVHRIEVRAHRLAEDECNGVDVPDGWEDRVLKSLDKLLNFKAHGIPVFINGDPRGYALKIDDSYVKAHNLDIHRDWGGYGILAPEFDGSR